MPNGADVSISVCKVIGRCLMQSMFTNAENKIPLGAQFIYDAPET